MLFVAKLGIYMHTPSICLEQKHEWVCEAIQGVTYRREILRMILLPLERSESVSLNYSGKEVNSKTSYWCNIQTVALMQKSFEANGYNICVHVHVHECIYT